jgi:hypothetical protein
MPSHPSHSAARAKNEGVECRHNTPDCDGIEEAENPHGYAVVTDVTAKKEGMGGKRLVDASLNGHSEHQERADELLRRFVQLGAERGYPTLGLASAVTLAEGVAAWERYGTEAYRDARAGRFDSLEAAIRAARR